MKLLVNSSASRWNISLIRLKHVTRCNLLLTMNNTIQVLICFVKSFVQNKNVPKIDL